jgi:hypothetical protein
MKGMVPLASGIRIKIMHKIEMIIWNKRRIMLQLKENSGDNSNLIICQISMHENSQISLCACSKSLH